VAELVRVEPIPRDIQEGLVCAAIDLSEELGLTKEEALSRIKEGGIHKGSPQEAAIDYFQELASGSPERIRHLLPYINIKKFAKDCLNSGKLVGAVFGGKTYTIEPGAVAE
jgi:hypothetical protein